MEAANDTPTADASAELEAKRVLEASSKKRIQECEKEINQVLAKHSCMLDPAFIFKSGIAPQIIVGIVSK